MIELLGILAGLIFSYAAIPQTYRTIKAGHDLGTPADISTAILVGCLMMYGYLTIKTGFDWIIALNYLSEVLTWGALLWYRLFRRTKVGS